MVENRNRKQFLPPFCRKNEFLGFSGDFCARCQGPVRSIFGPISYFMELNIWEKFSRFQLEHNIPFSWEAIVEISSAGYAPEAIISHLYLVDKTRYSSALCSLQYQSTAAAEMPRFIGCIVWSCNGKAVNFKNPPIFATLVKMTSYSKWRRADPEIFSPCQFMDAGQRSASAAELQPLISSQSTSAKFVVQDFPLDVLFTRGCFPLSTAPVAQHYAARVF